MAIGNSLLVNGATIIDAVADKPISGKSIWIESGRIRAIGTSEELKNLSDIPALDAHGKYAIPGLMNANVHLLIPGSLERLARHASHYEDLIAEAAQVALRGGQTTVFDTWGPRRFLLAVRDQINNGEIPGSRIFCAGNIIGFDGPFSEDFLKRISEIASPTFCNHINSIWVENVGRHLMWLTPEQVAAEVRLYIQKGIDFVKYASNEHGTQAAGAFIQFSAEVQRAIVTEAHRAGITAQAHCMTVEGLRLALEAGCDLITHCNITGPRPMPESTIKLFLDKRIGAVVFPFTKRRLEWQFGTSSNNTDDRYSMSQTMLGASDLNVRMLIEAGAMLMMANDGGIWPPELLGDATHAARYGMNIDNLMDLNQGHFFWFKAMEEKGCRPIEILRAATRNIAIAYQKDKDLGTLEAGKVADIVILDKNPLASADHYRSISTVIKGGKPINPATLPIKPILMKPLDAPAEEEASYVPFLSSTLLPPCPMCIYGS